MRELRRKSDLAGGKCEKEPEEPAGWQGNISSRVAAWLWTKLPQMFMPFDTVVASEPMPFLEDRAQTANWCVG